MEIELGREIIRLVPQWYEAEHGPVRYAVPIGSYEASFCNHCEMSSMMSGFLQKISARTRDLQLEYFVDLPGLTDVLLESLAIEWLRLHSINIDWKKLIKYLGTLVCRTHENQPVALNLVIRPGTGIEDISRPNLQKFFDRLASTSFSYLAVDSDLRLMEYGEVEWAQVKRAAANKCHPEFLHPIHSVMEEDDFSAHLTLKGDIIIMNKGGLLAAKRQGKWNVYDVQTFKDSLSYCIGNPFVGTNLFEVLFDLSFKRQGSLLIYDPDHAMREHIFNAESIVAAGWRDDSEAAPHSESGQVLIARLTENIAIGTRAGSLKRKRRLLEMACVDGAVVFDDHGLLAVGALIESHPSVADQFGARSTAARSAYLWGAHPIIVSSDGDVSIHFQSKGEIQACDAVMHFL
jgi:hypothetical protein